MTLAKISLNGKSKTLAVIAAALAVNLPALSGAALAQTAPAPAAAPAALSAEDFVQVLATLAAFEQRAGKLAQVLGQNNDVRRYGRDLAEDSRLTQILNQGLAAARIDAPLITALPTGQSDWLSSLHRIDDREFDRMFLDAQVQTNQEALTIVQAYAQAGDNPAVKAAAAKLTPVFEQRVAQARAILRTAG